MNLTNLSITISGSRRRVRVKYVPTPFPEEDVDSAKVHAQMVRSKEAKAMLPSSPTTAVTSKAKVDPALLEKREKKAAQKEEAAKEAKEAAADQQEDQEVAARFARFGKMATDAAKRKSKFSAEKEGYEKKAAKRLKKLVNPKAVERSFKEDNKNAMERHAKAEKIRVAAAKAKEVQSKTNRDEEKTGKAKVMLLGPQEEAKEQQDDKKLAQVEKMLWTEEPDIGPNATHGGPNITKRPFAKLEGKTAPIEIWQACEKGMSVYDCEEVMRKAARLQAKMFKNVWAREDGERQAKQYTRIKSKTGVDPLSNIPQELCQKKTAARYAGKKDAYNKLSKKIANIRSVAQAVAKQSGDNPKLIKGCSGREEEEETSLAEARASTDAHVAAQMALLNRGPN